MGKTTEINQFRTQFLHFFKLEAKRQLNTLPTKMYLKIEPADGLPFERVNRIAKLAFEKLLEDFATTDAYIASESLDDMIHWAVSVTVNTEIMKMRRDSNDRNRNYRKGCQL